MLGQQILILFYLTLLAITGGHEASLGKYPYHAIIRYRGEHQCSGSIIDQHHILSAYACIIGTSISDLAVEVGTNSLKTSGVQYKIRNIIIADTSYHDIVLLHTHKNIVFNHKVSPIEITPYDYKRNGYPIILTAFKRPPNGEPFTDKLQEYRYEIFNGYGGCMVRDVIANERLMCFIKSDRKRVCNADFGGAIVADNYLIGVKLPGDQCVGTKPEQHLRIYHYFQGIVGDFHLRPNTNSGDLIKNFSVMTGINSIGAIGHTYEIQDIITPDDSGDDIALLRTPNEISFNDKVQPIDVTDHNHKQNGYPVILTAFKRLPTGKLFTDKLQAYNYKIYNGPQCRGKNIGEDSRYICFAKSDKERVCNMDYGGSIVAHKQIIGIKLYGDACVDGKPEVHLRVHHYLR